VFRSRRRARGGWPVVIPTGSLAPLPNIFILRARAHALVLSAHMPIPLLLLSAASLRLTPPSTSCPLSTQSWLCVTVLPVANLRMPIAITALHRSSAVLGPIPGPRPDRTPGPAPGLFVLGRNALGCWKPRVRCDPAKSREVECMSGMHGHSHARLGAGLYTGQVATQGRAPPSATTWTPMPPSSSREFLDLAPLPG
jgi:hypothetical protein